MMSKQHRKHKLATDAKQAHAERIKRRDRRLLIRGGLALAVAIPLAAIGVMQYERRASARRDLSVIGNGKPTVVQVFDYGCAECRQLRDNVAPLQREFAEQVQFRLAVRSQADGGILASRYNAGHITLLMFGPDGQLRNTLTGVQDTATIRTAISSSFPGLRASN